LAPASTGKTSGELPGIVCAACLANTIVVDPQKTVLLNESPSFYWDGEDGKGLLR
jgi:hypothetical protein